MASKKNNNACRVKMETICGCYQCMQGATKLHHMFHRKGKKQHKSCNNATILIRCTPHWTISQIRFHFSESRIDINFTVTCPAGNSVTMLKGQLTFVNEKSYLTEIQSIGAKKHTNSELHLEDIQSLFGKMLESLPTSLSSLLSNVTWLYSA